MKKFFFRIVWYIFYFCPCLRKLVCSKKNRTLVKKIFLGKTLIHIEDAFYGKFSTNWRNEIFERAHFANRAIGSFYGKIPNGE